MNLEEHVRRLRKVVVRSSAILTIVGLALVGLSGSASAATPTVTSLVYWEDVGWPECSSEEWDMDRGGSWECELTGRTITEIHGSGFSPNGGVTIVATYPRLALTAAPDGTFYWDSWAERPECSKMSARALDEATGNYSNWFKVCL